jgi:hypothetical protein
VLNFDLSTSPIKLNTTATSNITFRNVIFGDSTGSGTGGGTLRLNESGVTNVTVTGLVRLTPRDSSKTGGGFDGTASTAGQVSVLGDVTSTSLAPVQPILGATGTNKLVLAGPSAETDLDDHERHVVHGLDAPAREHGRRLLGGSGLTYTIGSGGQHQPGGRQRGDRSEHAGRWARAPSLARTSGRVVGRLKKAIATGPASGQLRDRNAHRRHAGDVDVRVGHGARRVALTTTTGEHPAIGTSGIKADKSVNRYFTVTNEGAAFDSASVLLQFVPGDVDAGANPDSFQVRKFDAPNWTPLRAGPQTGDHDPGQRRHLVQ